MLQPEKIKGAVALGYDAETNSAPAILAKGKGELAERIIKAGEENNIFIQQDEMLFESLYPLTVGDEVPVKVYRAVAEILAFVYKLEEKEKAGII
ncbi:MAG: EscU/YscU/HrcU family type III secretion system export apparatus switch protein [Ignavibacteriales bacterium]|nr:MAG: EscU/YscU/HrcU family type III secretion system export apparatus switch protein [Ignavibacteriales bacterium]